MCCGNALAARSLDSRPTSAAPRSPTPRPAAPARRLSSAWNRPPRPSPARARKRVHVRVGTHTHRESERNSRVFHVFPGMHLKRRDNRMCTREETRDRFLLTLPMGSEGEEVIKMKSRPSQIVPQTFAARGGCLFHLRDQHLLVQHFQCLCCATLRYATRN